MELVLPILSGAVVEVTGRVDLGDDASRVAGEHVDLVATTTGEVLIRHQGITAIGRCVALNLRLEPLGRTRRAVQRTFAAQLQLCSGASVLLVVLWYTR